ncbi:MAG: hypothetical protein P8P36_05800, partial [Akkermansiaceae bacterium]|nr:hypothetical protein [Akkermansiaceae bacterium]
MNQHQHRPKQLFAAQQPHTRSVHTALAAKFLWCLALALTALTLPSEVCAKTKKVDNGDKDLSVWTKNSGELDDDIEFKDNGLTK